MTSSNPSHRAAGVLARPVRINGLTLPEPIPAALHRDLRAQGLESLTLSDPPAELDADTRRWAVEFAARQVRRIREEIFPVHGL